MEYRVLGSLEVRSDGESIALGPPKQRAMLAILLLHAGEIVPTDRLIQLLWGEQEPRTAAHSVQVYVSELRKALEGPAGTPVIVTRPPGYVLEADPELVDVRRFERLLGQATRDIEAGDPSAGVIAIREALGLWRGPPLSDFTYEEFAQEEIRRLEAVHVDALEQLADAELTLGREQAALPVIDLAITEDPFRERPRALQMLALYRAGRHPEALRAYQQFSTLLDEELGIEPGPSLQQLQERVLLHDPTLARAAGPAPASGTAPVRNPYKGLRPFAESDADDFFGREALVAELVAALADGARLLALVGPSGSGKSSVLRAGLIPALRSGAVPGSERWVIAEMMPGEHPLDAYRDSIQRIAPGGGRRLLVIDQFEELYSISDAPERQRLLRTLATAVTDPGTQLVLVLALRADYYDRPLLEPGFAAAFVAGVVNVLPMTAAGLEAAVVGPARRVGIEVDPALLAQLMADAADRPGALPLLQYTLTQLFERRSDDTLTLAGYRALGGLRDVLSRRAEELYARLSADRQQVALQVFLRLVRLVDEARLSRRRVPLRELTGMELDPVAMSEVLDEFGRQRLLSFDRDPATGGATVEVAHEALLWEWERLAAWIDRHRADLRQHDSLAAAADEWESSGRQPDYLLIGSRLAEYEAWRTTTALRLTAQEREFLRAGLARRDAELAEEKERRDRQRALERRARTRLWAMLGAVALLAAAVTFGVLSWLGSGPPEVVLLFEGTGDAGFGDMAAEGFGDAVSEFGLDAETRVVSAGTREVETELLRLSEDGVKLVVVGVGSPAAGATAAVAVEHPETRYVTWESFLDLPNLTDITFRSEEAAFLAGAAAALTSRTGTIGFTGAFPHPIIDAYLAGFKAGALRIVPDVKVLPSYLAELPDYSGIESRELGAREADALYSAGADVILAVGSSLGAVQAAHAASETHGRRLWVIGVDTDTYLSVLDAPLPDGLAPGDWQEHILTSVTKELDTAVHKILAEYARGSLAPGARSLGLADGAVGISYTGGFLDPIHSQLEDLREQIISGRIRVPSVPEP